MQSLTLQVQFFPSRREQALLRQLGNEYIRVVNALAEQALAKGSFPNITTEPQKSGGFIVKNEIVTFL